MVASLVLAIAASAAQPPAPPREPASIAVAEGRILARDIARTSPDGEAVVATLPTGTRQIELSEERRRALLRNRFPGGAFSLLHGGTLRVVRGPGTAPAQPPGTCFAARADIASGTSIGRELLEEVACTSDAAGRWLAHDGSSRTLLARLDIPAGTYLGRIRPGAVETVAAGSRLVFRSNEGPVTIEREVVALQPARAGKRLFARTQDGEVLRSTLEEGEEDK